jgi:hypothetical protein
MAAAASQERDCLMPANILVLNRWPQYPNSDRWDNELARYSDLISHVQYRVTYICDTLGQQGLSANCGASSHIHVIPDFADVDAVIELVGKMIQRNGAFDHVIAFSEYLLDLAALIRERYDIPGPRPADIDRFRDKPTMKTVLQKADIPLPRWTLCTSTEHVLQTAVVLGFPLILKPRRGASSKGVRKISSAEELASVCSSQSLDGYEMEQYIEGDLLHADGVVDRDGVCIFMSISRYISPCLEFESGAALGSVVQTEPRLLEKCRTFALRCLAALELRSSAFHLEFFSTGNEFVFLEIGARVPGADVSYVIHDVYGVNLFQLWVDVLLGHHIGPLKGSTAESGGWLTIPRPKPLPQKVLSATPLMGKVPFLYRELVPRAGDILEDVSGYANLQGGRFLFRGGTAGQIAEAIRSAQAQYTFTTTQLQEA